MTDDEARAWAERRWSGAVIDRLDRLAALVIAETARQNLIAPSTVPTIWNRHIVDSAQLIELSSAKSGLWLDIGSGAGFPGLVVACVLDDRPVMLIEPRARRADFLIRAAGGLGLSAHVSVEARKVSAITAAASVISARAVAPLDDLFAMAQHCATADTCWILPKGKSAGEEVARAQRTWHGVFHVEHSVTDPDALIVVANRVTRR